MSLEPLAVMFQFLTLVGDSFLVDQIFTYILVTIQRQDTQDDLTFLYMLDFLTWASTWINYPLTEEFWIVMPTVLP